MSWEPFVSDTPGARGSEGGEIIRDDEHVYGARITLEKDGAISPFAITCGIYGWMMHTRFFASGHEAAAAYEAMKVDLAAIVEELPLNDDADLRAKMKASSAAMSAFVDKYP